MMMIIAAIVVIVIINVLLKPVLVLGIVHNKVHPLNLGRLEPPPHTSFSQARTYFVNGPL